MTPGISCSDYRRASPAKDPTRRGGQDPKADFFRRYGALCLLAGADPYPVPLLQARTFLSDRGLIESGGVNVLRLLTARSASAGATPAVQRWLDGSEEAAEATRLADQALAKSTTLDEYFRQLRALLAGRGPSGT